MNRYPLSWPEGWSRTLSRERVKAPYKVTIDKARKDLQYELRMLGAEDVVISSNVPLRKDGQLHGKAREPDDPGVAVYWTLDGQPQVMACDKWDLVRSNLRAVGLAIGALRMLERTGASEIMQRAFRGFAALPSSGGSEHWRSVLGIDPTAPVDRGTIQRAWREQVHRHHPDHGGSSARLIEINRAKEQALREIG